MCALDKIRRKTLYVQLGSAFNKYKVNIIQPVICMLFITSNSIAAPTVSSVLPTTANTLILEGLDFGAKLAPAPRYFNNFESDIIGSVPSGQMANTLTNEKNYVKANLAYSGSKSQEFDYCADAGTIAWSSGSNYKLNNVITYGGNEYLVILAVVNSITLPPNDPTHFQLGRPALHCDGTNLQNSWKRSAIDLGQGEDKIYISTWIYLDKGTTTATSWQWKSLPSIVSTPSLYYDSDTTNNTSAYTAGWYMNNAWKNPSAYVRYFDLETNTAKYGVSATSNPADLYLWNQWQRVEFYAQRSSASKIADGIWRGSRIGRSSDLFSYSNAITHQTGNNPWRYIALSHAVESVYDGYVDLKIYMDDIYVDTTQSRVEVCDKSTWVTRTHCEIQPATSWATDRITVNFNRGSFTDGQKVYFYVVDSNGVASSAGYPFTIGATPPAAPKNLIKTNL